MPLTDARARELLGVLSGFSRSLQALARNREHTVSNTRIGILRAVRDAGPLRLGDLAARIGIAASVATRTVQALEAEGLVERAADPDDARAYRIALNDAGRDALRAREEWTAALLREHLDDWDDADAATAVEILGRLEHAVREFGRTGQAGPIATAQVAAR